MPVMMANQNQKMSSLLRLSYVGPLWASRRAKELSSDGLDAAKAKMERSVDFNVKKMELLI